MNFLTWLQETEFVQFLASDPYAYPIMLCFHAVGMAVVVGLVWMMSVRVLGHPRGFSIATFERMGVIALWGFAINAISGFLIFTTEATRVIVNLEFQLKIACIVLGSFAAWFMVRAAREAPEGEPYDFSPAVKVVAVLSSVAWLLAIVFGRQIAYTIKPPF